jgi:hypothetical protein
MHTDQTWRDVFCEWPSGIARRGIVVSSLNEAIPFKGFMTKGDTVLLERTNPDSLGARIILLPYGEISSVKFVDPLKEATFAAAGYTGKFAKE